MWFKLYTLLWIVAICMLIFLISTVLTSVFSTLKYKYVLIITYILSNLLATIFEALPDPNKLGIIANTISIIAMKEVWLKYELPYLISMVITLFYFNLRIKENSDLYV
jgi:hypothetical protein